jgi:hypothetical protein
VVRASRRAERLLGSCGLDKLGTIEVADNG